MPNLEVALPLPRRREPRKYTLKINFGIADWHLKDDSDLVLEFCATTVLQIKTSEVYKGTLKNNGETYPAKVVCKFAEGDDIERLEKEVNLYTTTLYELEGTVVPYFVCYCTGTSPYTGKAIGCLMTRYAGRHYTSEDWLRVRPRQRYDAFVGLVKLHRAGIQHHKFTPRSIAVDDYDHVTIVDFGEAVVGHTCGVVDKKYPIFNPQPSKEELNCDEVYKTSIDMDIWTPTVCDLKGVKIDMLAISSISDIVKVVLEHQPGRPVDQVRVDARDFLHAYVDHYIRRRREAIKAWEAEQQGSTKANASTSPQSTSSS